MEIRLYFQMLRRGWWIILLTLLTALAVALVASYLATPEYEAIARFIITPSNVLITGNEVVQGLNTLDRQSVVFTYVEVMNSDRIYNDALADLNLNPIDIKDYAYKSVVLSTSSVLELSVTGPDPQIVANLANAIGNQTINFTRGLNQIFVVEFLDVATPPNKPYSPRPALYASLAIALGLIVGAFLAILSEQLRTPFEAFLQYVHLDNVTNVYNNTYFRRLVEEEIAENSGDIFTLGIVELSGLRDVLETYPTPVLERVLQNVTSILRRELRGHDIIGRWNGVSFVVMLPSTSGDAASRIFGRVFQSLSEPIKLDHYGTSINLDSHIGAAEYGADISVDELFEKAVSTLEQARRDNANPVYVWEMKNPFWT